MRRGAAAALAIAAVATASLAVANAASIRPSHNPANGPRLLGKPIQGFRYDWGTGCKPADRIPPGMHALERWLTRKVPRGESWGIHNCHILPGGHWSLHSDNRAIDWHLDKANRKDRRQERFGRHRKALPAARSPSTSHRAAFLPPRALSMARRSHTRAGSRAPSRS